MKRERSRHMQRKSFNLWPISFNLFENPLIDCVYAGFLTDFEK
ncbi:conserved hypothetical protein [delta proteobacterium NaphS2]|nr:conserved hypothetical protein [delta proteobacterium NaphS2]